MFCKNCGEAMNENQAICLKCGVKKGEGNAFCANCGAAMPAGAEICMNCGVKKDGLNGQNKWIMALIAFFIGEFGVHNFIMGETKKGVLKIVLSVAGVITCGITTIVCAVFKWIEIIKILMDTYSVDPEKYI